MNWRMLRDRWLGNPAIRDRIGRWPIGRRISDRHARRLFGVIAGFVETQMLAAAIELDVFDRLRDGPQRWEEVVDLPAAGARALRQALTASGLIEPRGSLVALTIDGLVVATDAGLQAMIRHNRLLYADLAEPVALLRGEGPGRIAAFWPYVSGSGDVAGYNELMALSQPSVIDAVLATIDFTTSRHVMDVGGGSGTFLRALHRRCPRLELTLVDLPAVVAKVDAENFAVRGVTAESPLPQGADTATLIRVLHDHNDEAAAELLARVATALPDGGRIVIAEPMAQPGCDHQTGYFAGYFAAMRSGRLRSPSEIAGMLRQNGFDRLQIRQPSALLTTLTARCVATS